MLQAPSVIRHLEMRMGRVVVRIVSLVCVVVFILHLFACIFHSVALWNESTLSWVEASGIVNRNSLVDRCCLHPEFCVPWSQHHLMVDLHSQAPYNGYDAAERQNESFISFHCMNMYK